MSKQNKANKTNYDQAGRLSQDDAARERQKQMQTPGERPRERATGRKPETTRGAAAPSRRRSEPEE